ncbi:conserved hypothetical protein [Stigmatella aurantiaca DW4/3-1]|uniref:Uncharacterized protein n=1 Tax=Stigmatella aurantiaca (strain DW4/3-1) TaxID=378806 RepID=Q08WK0_STIAD|nr:conserved hypothetical protein [Stigmatella aurantiaca DW4/3-1]
MVQRLADELTDDGHLRLLHSPRGDGRRAHPDARGRHRLLGIERNHVLVHGEARLAHHRLGVLAGDLLGAQVHQHQVVVRPAGAQAQPCPQERLRQRLGIGDDLPLVHLEFRGEGLLERHGLGGDDVHQRPALDAGEDLAVERLGELLTAQDEPAPRPPERLVRGGGDELRQGHGRRVNPRGHQAGDVRHVHHHRRAHAVGDLAELAEIERARVGARAHDDDLGLVLLGQARHLGEVDGLRVPGEPIVDHLVELAGEVEGRAVGEVAARVEVQGQEGVPRLHQGHVGGHVGLAAGVGLDVGGLGPEQIPGALDRQRLRHVDHLAPAVVALAGVALGVLVRQRGTHCLEHGGADEVLRGNQLDAFLLALRLLADDLGDLGIDLGQRAGIFHGSLGSRQVRRRLTRRLPPPDWNAGLSWDKHGETARHRNLLCAPSERQRSASASRIFCTRFSCRPPSKGVARKASRMDRATPAPTTRCPRQSTLASLCARAMRASNSVEHRAARTPRCLLAAMLMPMPVPHTSTPSAYSPLATARATFNAKSG